MDDIQRQIQGLVDAVNALASSPDLATRKLQIRSHLEAKCQQSNLDWMREIFRGLRARSNYDEDSIAVPPLGIDELSVVRIGDAIFSGSAHNDYQRHHAKLEPIFSSIFPNWHGESSEREVKPIAHIPLSTLYSWRAKWMKNASWRPWNMRENHGAHKRLFTDAQEAQMKDEILNDYIASGNLFTSVTFRTIAVKCWQNLGKDPIEFKCSDKFIAGFKDRNGFSSRRFHTRRRNRTGERGDICAWIQGIRDLIGNRQCTGMLDRVVNCDETAWRVLPTGLLTWAPMGADGVTVRLDGNEKDSVTVLASVTASGRKLPLFAIAKGTTTRSERNQLGQNSTLVRDHSPSGWSTLETFKHYLDWLAGYFAREDHAALAPGDEVDLILDCYSVHRSFLIKEYAREHGIKLWFIPAGHTDELQPLDRAVFGAIKSIFRRRFEALRRESPNDRVTKSVAIDILIDIWENVSPASIAAGWAIYEEDFGPDQNAPDAPWEE
jgi:hypothetical protein